MNSRSIHLSTLTAVAIACLGIAGCGGGGGSGGIAFVPPPADSTVQVEGIAASGSPIAGAHVSLHCANDVNGSAETNAEGAWSSKLGKPQFPCLVTLSGGSLPEGTTLHSLAVGPGRLNITPLTDLVLARIAQKNPAALDDLDGKAIAALAERLQAALDDVARILVDQGFDVAGLDIFTGEFEPKHGDKYDDLLERIALSLADDDWSYEDLIDAIAASDEGARVLLPNTLVYKADALAAMPQLNKGSLSTAAGTLTMTLGSGSNNVGAFVGGGTGNKAVLQLQGLNGMKLHDLKSISIDLQGDAAGVTASPVSPYVSVNLTIDLQCSTAPVPAEATLADLTARRRILSFDPYYYFIQASQRLSSSEVRTMAITPATPGWRISAGAPVGSVAVAPNYQGTETLEGFDYEAYPDACVVDGATGDAGMFRNTAEASCAIDTALAGTASASCGLPYSGGLLFLGSSSAVEASQWQVHRVTIESNRSQTYRFE